MATRIEAEPARSGQAHSDADGAAALGRILLERAPPEDLVPYDGDALGRASALAFAALKRHRQGASIVAVDADGDVFRHGRPVTVVTLVNDNMPFLFDSVMGELTEGGVEPFLVVHPVLSVLHGEAGVERILDHHASARDAGADKVSLIHVHLQQLSSERAAEVGMRLARILGQARDAVAGWQPMLARLHHQIADYRYQPVPLDKLAVDEAVAFLEWLRDDNFTFLGMRDFRYTGDAETGELEREENPGLGILSDPDLLVLRAGKEAVTTTPEVRAFLHGPEPLIVTKANTKSLVHRRVYLDYIGVKTFNSDGRLRGELRIVGLFTSTAYTRSVTKIPYLRSKTERVIAASGFSPDDHSGKALINVLESYPRDELFQIGVPLLVRHAASILALGERPRIRALVRVDQFDRFVSVIVFVPRDRYDSEIREKIGDWLKTAFEGRLSAYYPAFPEGGLARVHFIIGRSGGPAPEVEESEIEAAIRDITRTWEDALAEAAEDHGALAALAATAASFPPAYRSSFTAGEALEDAARVAALSQAEPVAIDVARMSGQSATHATLKVFSLAKPVALSERVPLLEHMGFRVISERTFEIARGGETVFLHAMEIESASQKPIDLADGGALIEGVYLSVAKGESDDDAYSALAQAAGLDPRRIAVLRAYGRYLQQAGIPQSPDFVAGVLGRYPAVAADLAKLFDTRLDPARERSEAEESRLAATVTTALEDVPSLDDDTILRRFLNLIQSTLRTNAFAPAPAGETVSFAVKLDAQAVAGLPNPRPWREIFVYGPEVEGVHLRFGPVARGGLRWSDRAQDYRTEVLGLVKAQQVKNAVIVPVGAKGGFFPKRLPKGGSRDAVFQAGTAAYVNFVTSLLSVTDNIDGDRIVPPPGVVRHDGDDPYFVVAADKGTATFSDTANAISQKHHFWLDDAFASGGSAGYDHKGMGITARGAWEAVKRHFRELDRDIQRQPFTVMGVGDMSGDVFGNGMLLSPEIRLIAAFDHRDIFIDPDPDQAASLAERQRLFALPRSSWQDYDRTKISAGGGVFARTQKSIALPEAAARAIGLARTSATPAEIMNAILKAPADLLWFGGIGTYVRGFGESNADVGDRANDAVRITAAEIGAKVVGEGANLGMTQRARIEYGLAGGRCNSDAIDNSAGVNTSDVEVNIKIALADAMRKGALTRPDRDTLLASMTEDVSRLVLANNYQQTLAISLAERRGLAEMPHQARFIASLEARGLLDRKVETLPSEAALTERAARNEPLTRAEIGVLLAYAKLTLFSDIVAGDLPDDDALAHELLDYFPKAMLEHFGGEVRAHRLRREIIATRLANEAINRGGPSFVTTLGDLTGAMPSDIVAAFAVVRDGFGLESLFAEIDALDGVIAGAAQLGLYGTAVNFIQRMTAWQLKNARGSETLAERIDVLKSALATIAPDFAALFPQGLAALVASRKEAFAGSGVPDALAERLAMLDAVALVPDIGLVAARAGVDLATAAKTFFAITEAFRIGRIELAAQSIRIADSYDELALSRAGDMIDAARRGMAAAALSDRQGDAEPVTAWLEAGGERVAQTRARLQALTEGGEITLSRFSVASGLMSDLAAV